MSLVLDLFTKTTATVWPFLGVDDWAGGESYGTPFQIKVTFDATAEQMRDNAGREFVSSATYWTSDQRPQYQDRIALGSHTGTWQQAKADQIRNRRLADAGVFGVGQVDVRLSV